MLSIRQPERQRDCGTADGPSAQPTYVTEWPCLGCFYRRHLRQTGPAELTGDFTRVFPFAPEATMATNGRRNRHEAQRMLCTGASKRHAPDRSRERAGETIVEAPDNASRPLTWSGHHAGDDESDIERLAALAGGERLVNAPVPGWPGIDGACLSRPSRVSAGRRTKAVYTGPWSLRWSRACRGRERRRAIAARRRRSDDGLRRRRADGARERPCSGPSR